MFRSPNAFLLDCLRRGSSRRRLMHDVKTAGLVGFLGLFGVRAARASSSEQRSALLSPSKLTEIPDNTLIVPGPDFALELSAKGAGADIRNWVAGQIGNAGGPLFINNHAGGSPKTVINLHSGSVGIGTASPGAKLHVVGDVRVDGMLVGPLNIVSPHPDNPELELISASPIAGEASSFTRGSGTLIAGEAIVELPEHFALLTESEGLTVQLTARDAHFSSSSQN